MLNNPTNTQQQKKPEPLPTQYYTLETLKNITTVAVAITLVCGLIMNFYKQGTNKEINIFLINSIALLLCSIVVIINQYKREPGLNKGQHILLIVFNCALLYASVSGATGIASSFRNAQNESEKSKQAEFFSFLLPTRPLYGVSESVYNRTNDSLNNTQNKLYNSNQTIREIKEFAQRNNDSITSAIIEANSQNVTITPNDSKAKIIPQSLAKVNAFYDTMNTYWVYVGQVINSKWQPQNFDFSETPKVGDEIVANKPVYKRDALPEKVTDDYWRLGKVVGLVSEMQKLKVVEIKKIEGDNYWARVGHKRIQ